MNNADTPSVLIVPRLSGDAFGAIVTGDWGIDEGDDSFSKRNFQKGLSGSASFTWGAATCMRGSLGV